MAQYKTTVSVTNGSANVVIAGDVTAEIDAGDVFSTSDYMPYVVASRSYVAPNTTVVLSAPYQGITAAVMPAFFIRDFTTPDGIPLLTPRDGGQALIYTRAMTLIQTLLRRVNQNVAAVVTPYPVVSTDNGKTLIVTATAAGTLTLPEAANMPDNFCVWVKNRTGGTLNIARTGTNTIDGATSATIASNGAALYVKQSASAWVVL